MILKAVSKLAIHRRRWLGFLLPALFCALSSCATIPELGGIVDRGGTSGRRIEVDLTDQKATLLQHGKVTAVSPISSGREGKTTPTGKFRIVEKEPNHRSSLYGNYVRNGKVVKENVDIRKAARRRAVIFKGCLCLTSCGSAVLTAFMPGTCRATLLRPVACGCLHATPSGSMMP
jgi:hypothetical protein